MYILQWWQQVSLGQYLAHLALCFFALSLLLFCYPDYNVQQFSDCDGPPLLNECRGNYYTQEIGGIHKFNTIHTTVGENLSPQNHKQPCDGATLSQHFAKLSRIRPLGTTVNITLQSTTLAIRTQVSY